VESKFSWRGARPKWERGRGPSHRVKKIQNITQGAGVARSSSSSSIGRVGRRLGEQGLEGE
jgi:hypothetical protein